jgi:integrase
MIPTPPGITLPVCKGDRDVRIAPNIWKTWCGWRAYVRHQGKLVPKRFTNAQGDQAVLDWIAGFKTKAAEHTLKVLTEKVARKGSLRIDAKTYLALETVKAMPTFEQRAREIKRWVDALGDRARTAITDRDINDQLQRWINSGLSGGTVNRLRTALMSLYTTLDGAGAANPVKASRTYPEAEELPRGRDYTLLVRILDAIPDRGRGEKGVKGSAGKGSQSKARLELFVWTGMTPAQMMLLSPDHFNIAQRWYVSPRRKKGKQPRFPRPVQRKEMTDDAAKAFARFVELECWGTFSRPSLRSLWLRGQTRVEADMRKELGDPKFKLPRVRLYDIRHSVGTAVTVDAGGNLGPARELLDHASERTTRRYAQAAVPAILKNVAATFAARHGRAALATKGS